MIEIYGLALVHARAFAERPEDASRPLFARLFGRVRAAFALSTGPQGLHDRSDSAALC
jgi:hypothetical protein